MTIAADQTQRTLPGDGALALPDAAADQVTMTSRCCTASASESPISHAGFVGHIDACVRYLAAWLGGLASGADAPVPDAGSAERSRVQLWRWLHGGDAALDDGTPIDFALFDAALQRVGERLPRRGLPGQEKLLQAAWLLAELTHAGTLTDISVQARAP